MGRCYPFLVWKTRPSLAGRCCCRTELGRKILCSALWRHKYLSWWRSCAALRMFRRWPILECGSIGFVLQFIEPAALAPGRSAKCVKKRKIFTKFCDSPPVGLSGVSECCGICVRCESALEKTQTRGVSVFGGRLWRFFHDFGRFCEILLS